MRRRVLAVGAQFWCVWMLCVVCSLMFFLSVDCCLLFVVSCFGCLLFGCWWLVACCVLFIVFCMSCAVCFRCALLLRVKGFVC